MKHRPLHVYAVNRTLKIEMHYEVFGTCFQHAFLPADVILLAMSLPLRFPLSVILQVELVSLTILDPIMWSCFFVCVYVCRGNLKLFFARKNLKTLHRDGSLLKMGMYFVCTLYSHLYESMFLHTFNQFQINPLCCTPWEVMLA